MLLQLPINRTLTAQPCKRPLRLLPKLHLRHFRLTPLSRRSSERRRIDANPHGLRPRPDPHVHAPSGHQFRLRVLISRKHSEQRRHIFIRQRRFIAAEKAAHIAPRQPCLTSQVSLRKPPPLHRPLECHSKVTHNNGNRRSRREEALILLLFIFDLSVWPVRARTFSVSAFADQFFCPRGFIFRNRSIFATTKTQAERIANNAPPLYPPHSSNWPYPSYRSHLSHASHSFPFFKSTKNKQHRKEVIV